MPKGSAELTQARREEILAACRKLYETWSFKEITLKDIGQQTSFTRTSIYNYFETKEEIFLALYEREYDRWNADLEAILDGNETMTREQLASAVAASIGKREQLLKLLSMNNYDMESNSRPERLVSFKAAYGKSLRNVRALLDKFCPEMKEEEKQSFLYVFFPFMFGIYPYGEVTDKQRKAMEDAGVDFAYQSVYDITYQCLIRLLGA